VAVNFLAGCEEDLVDIYIVGGEGNWSLTEPLGKMTNLGNGIYVDTVKISAPIYFVFADGGPEAWNNDWPTFNSTYRYGPASTTTVVAGTQYSTEKRNNDFSYYFTGDGSDYVFTFDADHLTFTIEVVENQPTVLLGDVNGDGTLSIKDVTELINYLLAGEQPGFNAANADVNQDGKISITDVTGVISIVLNQ
jgi:hypothetical protein